MKGVEYNCDNTQKKNINCNWRNVEKVSDWISKSSQEITNHNSKTTLRIKISLKHILCNKTIIFTLHTFVSESNPIV